MNNSIKSLVFIFVLFLITNTHFAQLRDVTNNAFGFGERLSFDISYSFITAAEASFSISGNPVNINGRDTYEINFDASSRSIMDAVYKVKDNYKSYIDVKGIFPWKFEQHIDEKNFKKDYVVYFMQDSLKAQTVTNGNDNKTVTIPQYVQDIVSSFYYVRTLDLSNKKEGDVITVPYFADDKTTDLVVTIGERDEVDVDAGKFRTIIVKPELKSGFTSKTSDITIWLTDDDRKIPVKVKMGIIIGSLNAELTHYDGLKGPLNAKE